MLILGDEKETSVYPVINVSIIAITWIAFVAQLAYPSGLDALFSAYGFTPTKIIANPDLPQFATLVTSMFLHGGLMHIVGNMWFLHVFGDNVEEFFGRANYLLFYLVCGIAGAIITVLHQPNLSQPSIGASGAISGVLAAYLLLHPDAKITTWWGGDSIFFAFRTFEIPAWVIIGGWFLIQYVCLYLNVPGIGWVDHIGGFTAGLILTLAYKTVRRVPSTARTEGYKPYVAGRTYLPQNQKSSTSMYETDCAGLTRQPLPANILRGAIVFTLMLATAGCASWLMFDNLQNRTVVTGNQSPVKTVATTGGAAHKTNAKSRNTTQNSKSQSKNVVAKHAAQCKVTSHHHQTFQNHRTKKTLRVNRSSFS